MVFSATDKINHSNWEDLSPYLQVIFYVVSIVVVTFSIDSGVNSLSSGSFKILNKSVRLYLKAVLGACINVVYLPLIIIPFMIFWIYSRIIFGFVFLTNNGKVTMLYGVDSFWRNDYENSRAYGHAALTFSGQPDLQKLKHTINKRVVSKKNPDGTYFFFKARQILFEKFGYMFMKDDLNFDIDNHLSVVNLIELYKHLDNPTPEELLNKYIYETHQLPIANGRGRLWEIKFLVTKQNEYVHLLKLHHSFADGLAMCRFIFDYYSDKPVKYIKVINKQTRWQRFRNNCFSICFLPFMLQKGLEKLNKKYKHPLNSGATFSGKKLSYLLDIPMQDLKEIRRKAKVSMHDILISAVSSSISKILLKKYGYKNDIFELIIAGNHDYDAPFSLKNTLQTIIFKIPTHIPEIENCAEKELRRLKFISEKIIEQSADPAMLALQHFGNWFIDILPTPLLKKVLSFEGSTVAASNVPGSSEDMTMLGDNLLKLQAWPPTMQPMQLVFAFISYKDNLGASILLEEAGLHSSKDAKELLENTVKEINNITKILNSDV